MGHRRRVLVVEDEPAMREVLRMRIEPWGFEVAVAARRERPRRPARPIRRMS